MPIRDIGVTVVVLALLPFCLTRPWIGVLLWSWLGYMNPHRLSWGFAYNLPFAQMVALATIVGLIMTKDRRPLPKHILVYLMLALWVLFFFSTLGAFEPEEAWDQFSKLSKILFMTFVTMLLIYDVKKVHALLYVIALSIGIFGLKGGIWALATGGGNQVLGPEGTFIGGNTEIGLALNMILPLLIFLAWHEPRRWARIILKTTAFFSVFAILFTYSRGAVLGLGIILPFIFLKSRARLIVVPLAFVGYLIGPGLLQSTMPEQWLERMGTIKTYDQDRSANQRLNAWYVAYRIGLDHPFLGGGFRPFSPAVYQRYSPQDSFDLGNVQSDAHSIYLQVLAEHGFVGLGLYLALIIQTLITLRSTIAASRKDPALKIVHDAARMVEVSLIGFLISGTFLSMSYFDLFFHLIAIAIILRSLVKTSASTAASGAATAPVTARPQPVPMAPLLGVRLQRERR